MSQWRRLPFVLMALFALCALMLPSLVWACPTSAHFAHLKSARASNSAQICRTMTKHKVATMATGMPCCAETGTMQMSLCQGKCCKPVAQLPAEDSNKNSALHSSNADFSGLLDQLSQAVYPIGLPARAIAPLVIEPPLRAIWDACAVSLPPAQFAPDSLLGRAPPRQF